MEFRDRRRPVISAGVRPGIKSAGLYRKSALRFWIQNSLQLADYFVSIIYTLENNWSRDVLEHQIESGLYEGKEKAITNFKDKLPANASDLAIQTLKDPYSFDFLTMWDDYNENCA